MSAEDVANLKQLYQLLQQEQVTWDEVEYWASTIPGMKQSVEKLRTLNTGFQPYGAIRAPSVADFELHPQVRAFLLAHVEPYVLFLDDALSMPERVAKLLPLARQNYPRKKNAMVLFCELFIKQPWRELSEAATAVLEAYETQETLLRGASSPVMSPDELLRAAQPGTGATDSLLRPVEEEHSAENVPRKSGWLARFRGKPKP